jgi:hypothetical protein
MSPLHATQLAPEGPVFLRWPPACGGCTTGISPLRNWRLGGTRHPARHHHFDHADLYGGFRCEALFGQWLKANPGQREHIQLVSKCGIKPVDASRGWQVKHYDSSRAHILASVDASLHNLGTDYLDLLLIHRPDPLLDPDEVADTFASLKASGKVRHFGVSNFSPSQFALLASRTPLLTNQVEASLLHTARCSTAALTSACRPASAPWCGRRWLEAGCYSLRPTLHCMPRCSSCRRVGSQPGHAGAGLAVAPPGAPHPHSGSRRLASLDEAAAACRCNWTASTGLPCWKRPTASQSPDSLCQIGIFGLFSATLHLSSISRTMTKGIRHASGGLFEQASGRLPMVPKVVQELIESFHKTDINIDEISDKVGHDQVLTARVLRLANTARFGGSRRVGSLDDAVVLLGFDNLRILVIASGITGATAGIPVLT